MNEIQKLVESWEKKLGEIQGEVEGVDIEEHSDPGSLYDALDEISDALDSVVSAIEELKNLIQKRVK